MALPMPRGVVGQESYHYCAPRPYKCENEKEKGGQKRKRESNGEVYFSTSGNF